MRITFSRYREELNMIVQALREKLERSTSTAEMELLARDDKTPPQCEKISSVHIEELISLLGGNNRKKTNALGLALALVDADGLISKLRREGALRASRYKFKCGTPKELVTLLIKLRIRLDLTEERCVYLNSVLNLYVIAPEAKRIRSALLSRLRARKGIALKSFLVLLDRVFAHGRQYNPFAQPFSIEHYSNEDISDAVSRILLLYREEYGLSASDLALTDPQTTNLLNSTYTIDLLDTLQLESLYKAEVLLDGLPYQADLEDGDIVIRSTDPNTEKSVRYGYIQTDKQVLVRHKHAYDLLSAGKPPRSIEVAFQELYDGHLSKFAKIIEKPIARIAIGIPDDASFFDNLSSNEIFFQELLMLLQLDVESYGPLSTQPIEIKDGVTSFDLFKVNRLFALMSFAMDSELKKIDDKEKRRLLSLHSVIPVMKKSALLRLLEALFQDGKAENVLSLLTMESNRDHVDIQYTPFIFVDDHYFLAPGVIANSNLVRNSIQANGLSSQRIKAEDPMQNAVAKALEDAGFLVGVEVGDKNSSKPSAIPEFDIVAYRDGVLYAFECKNNYHPCSAHERRNSYSAIKTGGKQLTKRKAWLTDEKNQDKLFQRLEWNVARPEAIHTCVLLSNRVFAGAQIDGHPVRQAHELINVILRGTITSDAFSLRFWKGETFATSDLDQFLGDSGLMKDHFDALKPLNTRRKIGSKTVIHESWYLDPTEEDRILRSRYVMTMKPEQDHTK